MLFLIFFNDFTDVIRSQLVIYSDDTTFHTCLNGKSNQFDDIKLYADLKNGLHSVVNRSNEQHVMAQNKTTLLIVSENLFALHQYD